MKAPDTERSISQPECKIFLQYSSIVNVLKSAEEIIQKKVEHNLNP